MEEVVKKVTELIKSNKTVVLIVLALIGILLITASGLFQKTDDKKESDVFDEKIYIDNLEKRIFFSSVFIIFPVIFIPLSNFLFS